MNCHMQNKEKGNDMEGLKEKINPRNWDLSEWRTFFVIAGLWNFSFSLPAFIMPNFCIRLMYGFQTDNFYIIFLNTVFFVTVFLFGIGYFMIAYDPPKNTALAALGIIGKILVGFLFYYLYYIGRTTIMPPIVGTGDLIFTYYFLYYLVKGPRS